MLPVMVLFACLRLPLLPTHDLIAEEASTATTGRDALVLHRLLTGDDARFDGTGGLEIPSTDALHAQSGFAVELWVQFADVSRNTTVVAKEGEYLLRLDPAPEGSTLSFFVNANEALEPRVRSPKPDVGKWYHVIATWDGDLATLWVNGERHSQRRRGAIEPTDSPVLIGKASKYGQSGLKGTLRGVRLYSRPLSDGEVLLREYQLDGTADGPRARQTRFEFDTGAEGWEAKNRMQVDVADGELRATFAGAKSLLVHGALDVPVEGNRFLSLRLSATQGAEGSVLFVTGEGPALVRFPLKADGRMHSYVLKLDSFPEWTGTLRALAFSPSDEECKVTVDFIRLAPEPEVPPEIEVETLLMDAAINRAQRPCKVIAKVRNSGGDGRGLTAKLELPAGVRALDAGAARDVTLAHGEVADLEWQVQAEAATDAEAHLHVSGAGATPTEARLSLQFTAPLDKSHTSYRSYVPQPTPAKTDALIGCHYCPLWKEGTRGPGWSRIVPFPKRKPALGWYDEGDPEVADWEIKWCLDHGIDFFVYCWYRQGQGGPVKQFLGHGIHEGLFNARYGDQFGFTIMWENQRKGIAGVSSEEDFLQNVVPFWIEEYFTRPNYVKVDNKPLLFIYRPEFLVEDLGGIENVRRALDKARELCKQAGFDGLTILGEYRGTHPKPIQLMADEGLDYAFQYCWPVGGDPAPDVAVRAQEDYWAKWKKMSPLPYLLTLTMGWDSTPWHPSYSKWHLPPDDFRTLCEKAEAEMATLPADSLGRKVVLLDNWNEFGEGHYIAPHREYGFGYLDAIRDAFSDAPKEHVDLVPEDLGLGPYDSLFRDVVALDALCRKRVTAPGTEGERGLIGWWTFDDEDERFALDYAGNGLGGRVKDAPRVEGIRGKALSCTGGSVSIPSSELLTPARQMTLECWLKTDVPNQEDRWFVNCEFGDGATGYRFGLKAGKLCFAVPKTAWSHHLAASEPLPTGRWVHAAATYDGKRLRVYMDGKTVGSMERTGRVNATDYELVLGNYATGHPAHFEGVLDEVRLYGRALSAEEILGRGTTGKQTRQER